MRALAVHNIRIPQALHNIGMTQDSSHAATVSIVVDELGYTHPDALEHADEDVRHVVERLPAMAHAEGLSVYLNLTCADWHDVHRFLDVTLSDAHAAEITHLSLTLARAGRTEHMAEFKCGSYDEVVPPSGAEYGRRFTSLRVLDVVQAHCRRPNLTARTRR